MNIIEHSTPLALISLIDEIGNGGHEDWGIVRVKRVHLKPMTNEAFLHAVRVAMQKADKAHAFFFEKRIYLAWRGEKKSVYKQLRSQIGTSLAHPGLAIDPAVMTTFIDPLVKGRVLKAGLQTEGESAERLFEEAERGELSHDMEEDDTTWGVMSAGKPALAVTHAQTEQFFEIRNQRSHRGNLQILVAEDQIFSQKLLCEILRGARTRNNNETPLIDTVQGIQEAWKMYLKKAPDIVFVDLGLIDGSGHTLARAIKELDPTSCVVIVTANNYEEELGVARQNNVDGFIAKPYNKKQILDCVDRYVSTLKTQTKGATRGSAGQFR